MERVEVDGDFTVPGNWKIWGRTELLRLHGALCKKLYTVVHEVSDAIPALENVRPGSSSGLLALSSLRIAVENAKNLLQYCSECSKLYLALTAECVLTKFEKARYALLESLHQLEETLPEALHSQIPEISHELENSVFVLDQFEKQVGVEVNQIIQNEKKSNGFLDDHELEFFQQTALRVGITSSAAALTERRALRRLLERTHAEEDTKKESIASYLLHLMRKYSNHFRSETMDSINSQCSSPSCSFSSISSSIDLHGNGPALEKLLARSGFFNFKQIKGLSGSMPLPPEELRCPISLQLMYDPVVIASGQTYERACIEKWFNSGNTTCPKTRKELSQLSMTPNYCIKGLIASWCEQNRVPVPSAPPESPKLKYLRISSLKSSKCMVTNGVSTVLFEEIGSKDDSKLDSEVAPEKWSRQSSREVASEICEEEEEEEEVSEEKCTHDCPGEAAPDKCDRWLRVLSKKDDCIDEQHEVVEQMRFMLKNDDELRDYAGSNGITEPLVYFVKLAVCREDVRSQEVGTMALFNLAVTNSRNKKQLLSAGVIPLMEKMIQNPETCEAAVAMYLNLSCLEEAQVIIGSSDAIPFLLKSLGEDGSKGDTCRLDALLTLYNLSLHSANIPSLISSGIIHSIHAVLTPSSAWTDKALTVLINIAVTCDGKKEIAANPSIVGDIVLILDNGEPAEQEKAVSCLWIICSGDEGSSQTVLQEGVIPALVSLTANGTGRAKDKAQKLLRLFREQRQRELEQQQPRVQLHEVVTQATAQQQQQLEEDQQQEEEAAAAAATAAAAASAGAVKTAAGQSDSKRPRLSRSKSKKFARVLTGLIRKLTLTSDRCKL